MAELLCKLVPSLEQVRLVSSGTEATMSAIRLARGFTGRSKIIKFEGCYHGHADSLLVKAGSGALTFGQPSSAGVPAETAAHTLVLDYNNRSELEAGFRTRRRRHCRRHRRAGRRQHESGRARGRASSNRCAGCAREHGSVLIFDEVMTGFRVALGGAQALYGIKPDLTTLGKVIGGGMPVGAFGGRRDIMQCVAPLGPVYQAGTLSGNPVAVAAGLATLKLIQAPGFYDKLSARRAPVVRRAGHRGTRARHHAFRRRTSAACSAFISAIPRRELCRSHAMRQGPRSTASSTPCWPKAIYLAPSAFEAGFVSAAHGPAELEKTIKAAGKVFASFKSSGSSLI